MYILANSVLVVIDMQNDFLDSAGTLYLGTKTPATLQYAIDRTIDAINAFKETNETIIVVKDTHSPADEEFDLFPVHCVKYTWGHELYPAIEEALGTYRYIRKSKHRLNAAPFIIHDLVYGPVFDNVYLAGVAYDICVATTAVGLMEWYKGKNITIIKDATVSYNIGWEFTVKEMLTELYGINHMSIGGLV
jgi:nicotinamidase/pyrazinamidase